MTGLASATFPDCTLPPVHDVMRIAANLFSAGGATTARLMSTSFRILGDRPDLQAALRDDPTLIPAFMEEALRLEPPIKGEFRLSKVAVTVGDMDSANKQILFAFAQALAANRAPEEGWFGAVVKTADVTGKLGLHDHPTGIDDVWAQQRELEAKRAEK